MTWGKRLTAVLLLLLLLEGAGGGPARAARAVGHERMHVVQPGERLSGIAATYGFDRPGDWRLLAAYDPELTDPHHLSVGQRIRIPSADTMRTLRGLPPMALQPAVNEDNSETVPDWLWERLAGCESSGNWTANTGNGFYGGLQFTLASWRLVGGSHQPHEAAPERQIELAGRLLELQGWEAWPVCSAVLGLR